MKKKDTAFILIDVLIACIKHNGIFKGLLISFYAIKIFIFKNHIKNNFSFLNLKMSFYDFDSLTLIFYELFGLSQYYFKTNTENPVIIDVGANIGDSVIYFKWLYPSSTIYAFEPHPKAYKYLKKNIELNNFTNVHSFNVGLSNEKKKVKLYDAGSSTFNSATMDRNMHTDKENKKYAIVNMDKISNFPVIIKLDAIDLIKIDIEGGESLLLRDLKILLPKTKKIIIEYHLQSDVNKNSFDYIINVLKKYKLTPSVTGLYRYVDNYTNPNVFLITGEKRI